MEVQTVLVYVSSLSTIDRQTSNGLQRPSVHKTFYTIFKNNLRKCLLITVNSPIILPHCCLTREISVEISIQTTLLNNLLSISYSSRLFNLLSTYFLSYFVQTCSPQIFKEKIFMLFKSSLYNVTFMIIQLSMYYPRATDFNKFSVIYKNEKIHAKVCRLINTRWSIYTFVLFVIVFNSLFVKFRTHCNIFMNHFLKPVFLKVFHSLQNRGE